MCSVLIYFYYRGFVRDTFRWQTIITDPILDVSALLTLINQVTYQTLNAGLITERLGMTW